MVTMTAAVIELNQKQKQYRAEPIAPPAVVVPYAAQG
jgi:hypothetical protein